MSDPILIGKTLTIRECGLDEYWLQEQIYKNPSILKLGDLAPVKKEKQQSSGGRLDFLLTDPEDDSMYEVEVRLGATDETHIIRTIEYWDIEKRRWPQRQHYAVLVAETITRRFFNVIQLFSLSIPIIAVQVNIIEAEGKRVLHFSKVLDTYEEPEIMPGSPSDVDHESWWRTNAIWSLRCAESLLKIISSVFPGMEMKYVQNYISLSFAKQIYFSFRKRAGGRSLLQFWLTDEHVSAATALLKEKHLAFDLKPYNRGGQLVRLSVEEKTIQTESELFLKLSELVKQSWQS